MGRISAALAILVVAAIIAFIFRAQIVDLTNGDLAYLVYMTLLLVLIGSGMIAFPGARLGPHWLRNAALWLLILFGAMGFYMIKDRLSDALTPSTPRSTEAGVTLQRADDGHFYADAEINGEPIRMLIDTGATDCALSRADAIRIGLDPKTLNYIVRVNTGKGEGRAAPANLGEVSVGAIVLNDVRAMVMEEGAHGSMLGMSFLDRLDGYEVRGNTLILHPKP